MPTMMIPSLLEWDLDPTATNWLVVKRVYAFMFPNSAIQSIKLQFSGDRWNRSPRELHLSSQKGLPRPHALNR